MIKHMELQQAISVLIEALKTDEFYRRSWIANIAMAYKDEEAHFKKMSGRTHLNWNDRHMIANDAAERFVNQLCHD